MTRITKEPEERRQEILDTAMKLFCENGYEQTSMSDIAQAMDVAQGLCYRYFPSKEALFDTAIDQYAQAQVDCLVKVLNQSGLSLIQTVVQMPTFLEAEAEESYAHRLCHDPASRKIHDQLSLCICRKMLPVVKNLLKAANDRGETHIQDIEAAASFCVYGQLGLLLSLELPREERVRRIKAFLLGILQKL